MRVLVTGASGLLGRALARTVPDDVALTALSRHELDVTDEVAVRRVVRDVAPRMIINAAAYTNVDAAETHSGVAMLVNGKAPGLLGTVAREMDVHVVHVSTNYVFAGQPCDEAAATRPLNAYGVSKLAGEQALVATGASHLIVRTQWLYDDERGFPLTMLRRAQQSESTRVVLDELGAPTLADDLARATWALRHREGILNIGCAGAAPWHAIAERIFARAGALAALHGCTSAEFAPAATRPANAALDVSLLRSLGHALPPWEPTLDAWIDRHLHFPPGDAMR